MKHKDYGNKFYVTLVIVLKVNGPNCPMDSALPPLYKIILKIFFMLDNFYMCAINDDIYYPFPPPTLPIPLLIFCQSVGK